MNEMRFVQLQEGSNELFDLAKEVWLPFIHEVFAIDLGTVYGLLDSPGYGTVLSRHTGEMD